MRTSNKLVEPCEHPLLPVHCHCTQSLRRHELLQPLLDVVRQRHALVHCSTQCRRPSGSLSSDLKYVLWPP